MKIKIFYEDLHPEFTGTKADFEELIFQFKKELSEWKKSKPVPKYDVIFDLLNHGEKNDFELVYKKDLLKGNR